MLCSPEEAPDAQTEAQHASQRAPVSQLQSSGVNSQEATDRRFDRRSPSLLRSVILALTTMFYKLVDVLSRQKAKLCQLSLMFCFHLYNHHAAHPHRVHNYYMYVLLCVSAVLLSSACTSMPCSTCSIRCNHTTVVQG